MPKKTQQGPRPDGLTAAQVRGIERWLSAIGHQTRMLSATLGIGFYERPPEGQTAADWIGALQQLVAAGPEGFTS